MLSNSEYVIPKSVDFIVVQDMGLLQEQAWPQAAINLLRWRFDQLFNVSLTWILLTYKIISFEVIMHLRTVMKLHLIFVNLFLDQQIQRRRLDLYLAKEESYISCTKPTDWYLRTSFEV